MDDSKEIAGDAQYQHRGDKKDVNTVMNFYGPAYIRDGDVIKGNAIGTLNEGEIHNENHECTTQVTGKKDAASDGTMSMKTRQERHRGMEDSVENTEADHIPGGDERSGKKVPEIVDSPVFDPKDNFVMVKLIETMTGKCLAKFTETLKRLSWSNVRGRVLESYEDLSEPDSEFYPQLKTGFKLYKGEYLPQEGFSAHGNPKTGRFIDYKSYLKRIQEKEAGPCAIIGQPGSGKTIMMKRLAKKLMIANNLHNQEHSVWTKFVQVFLNDAKQYDIVMHMNIRDIPDQENVTLANVIFSPSVTHLSVNELGYGLKAILDGVIKIIIFFDGLDQATWDPRCDRKIGPWEVSNTRTIFGNILAGYLLPNVPIIISSREHSVARLSIEMRPKFMVALVGFSEGEAEKMYCELMGHNSENDWHEMRLSNPSMHYMCLTPLFLVFYMITRKRAPSHPPNCASRVMVTIIQIFLECENTRNIDNVIDVYDVIGKLKVMAFNGTMNQQVTFTNEDLSRYGLAYKYISDVIIKVPGLTILGQKILAGMYRYFFSHQTLQEVLAALFVVEMRLDDFKQIVDREFQKPYWAVVRNFTSGILKNESVRSDISSAILKSGWYYTLFRYGENSRKLVILVWRICLYLMGESNMNRSKFSYCFTKL